MMTGGFLSFRERAKVTKRNIDILFCTLEIYGIYVKGRRMESNLARQLNFKSGTCYFVGPALRVANFIENFNSFSERRLK